MAWRAATWAIACAVSAAGCGSTGSDAHGPGRARSAGASDAAERVEASASKHGALKKRPEKPRIDGRRCAEFLPFLPSTIEGFRAKASAEGSDYELGGGLALSVLRRAYAKNGTTLDVEIVDTEQSKPLRDVFERTRELGRDAAEAVIKPTQVQGLPAVAQWNDTNDSARVSMLVADRYLVHVQLRPAKDVDRAVALAEKLDLEDLAELSPSAPIAAK